MDGMAEMDRMVNQENLALEVTQETEDNLVPEEKPVKPVNQDRMEHLVSPVEMENLVYRVGPDSEEIPVHLVLLVKMEQMDKMVLKVIVVNRVSLVPLVKMVEMA